MRRIPWDILLALLAGIGLGLGYAWVIAPRAITDATPRALRPDFKDRYRSAIAAAYAASDNLPRARARLDVLGDANPVEALNAQAQRMLAGSASADPSEHAEQVASLALALDKESGNLVAPAPGTDMAAKPQESPVLSPFPAATELLFIGTDTPPASEPAEPIESQPVATEAVPTPRPTRTSTPVAGAPFALTGQETICDPNLPDGLLQVLVLNPNRRQIPGIEIRVTWDGGNEKFFTGLKPELGNGYADYIMAPETTYTVQLARGSDVALGITPPTCQSSGGETFLGSVKLTFQQP